MTGVRHQATAAQWLDRVVPLGRTQPVAAVTALTLPGHLTDVETPQAVSLRYEVDQFSRHLADLQIYAAQLAELVDFPPTFISQRDALIARTVDSFFAAGQTVNPPI
jgi:hypothetical protein